MKIRQNYWSSFKNMARWALAICFIALFKDDVINFLNAHLR